MTDWVMKRSFPVPGGKVPWAARGCAVTISFFFGSVQDVVRQDKRSGPFRLRRSVPAPCTVRHAFFPTRTEKKEKKERKEKEVRADGSARIFQGGGCWSRGLVFQPARGSMRGSPLGAACKGRHSGQQCCRSIAWVATRAAPLELVAPVTTGLERAACPRQVTMTVIMGASYS